MAIRRSKVKKYGFYDQSSDTLMGLLNDHASGKSFVVAQAVLAILCIDLPFLIVRCAVTDQYGIVISTLFVKNVASIFLSFLKICYCGNISLMLSQMPALGMFTDLGEDA